MTRRHAPCIPFCALGTTLIAIGLVTSVSAQGGVGEVGEPPVSPFVELAAPWPLRAGPEPTPTTESVYGRALAGHFNRGPVLADGLLDAAVLDSGTVRLLVNPGIWTADVDLDGGPYTDMAMFPRGSSSGDALFLVDGAELSVMRFDEASNWFVAETIPGPWLVPVGLEALSLSNTSYTLVWVYDAATDLAHAVYVAEGADSNPHVILGPARLLDDPQLTAMVDWDDNGIPELATVEARPGFPGEWAVRLHSAWFTTFSDPFSLPVNSVPVALQGLDPEGGEVPRRLLLVSHDDPPSPLPMMRVMDPFGVEDPVEVPWTVTSVNVGQVFQNGGQDLLFGRTRGGAVGIVSKGCFADPRPPSNGTYPTNPPCILEFETADGAGQNESEADALFADFDGDGQDDVLLFEDESRSGRMFGRPSEFTMTVSTDDGIAYELTFQNLPEGAHTAEIRVWNWPRDPAVPTRLSQYIDDVAIAYSNEPVSGPTTIDLEFERPGVVYDVCIRNDVGKVIASRPFAFTPEFGIWCDFLRYQGTEVVQEATACAGPPPPPGAMGVFIGGIALRRLPPYTDPDTNTLPTVEFPF